MKIKTSQKNQLFQMITDSQLNVGMFRYDEPENIVKAESSIIVRVINHSFKFEMSESYHGTIKLVFLPGTDRIKEETTEINIEDKWANLDKFIEDANLETDNNILNDRFLETEYLEIKNKIDNLRIQFSQIDITPSQLAIINDKLNIILEQTQNLC